MNSLFHCHIIDKDSPIPLYFQLYTYIENLIQNDQLHEGEKLPSEDELVSLLGISRPTIRQAYKELSLKGLIQRKRSKGTVVTKPKVLSKFLSEVTSFYTEMQSESQEISTKVLSFEIVECHDQHVSDTLKTTQCLHLERLRYSDHIPVVYIQTYLPYKPYQSLLNYDLEKESLYHMMEVIGEPVQSVRRILNAGECPEHIAQYLEMEKNKPILLSQTVGKNQKEEAVEYSVAYYNGTYAHFQIDLQVKA